MSLRDAPSLDVSVVVPYFDPGPRVVDTLERLITAMGASPLSFEVLAVCDGSTDGSGELVDQLSSSHLVSLRLGSNQGKGAALRAGLSQARGRVCGFIDGDGDLDPAQLVPFCALMEADGEIDLVVGSKRHPRSEVVYPPLRRVYSWGFQQLTRVLFGLQVRDTQVGLKLVRRDVLAEVLPLTVERRFAFDVELLALCVRRGHGRIVEEPVRLGRRFSSTIDLAAVARMLADVAGVWWRLRARDGYRPDVAGEPTLKACTTT